jgi:hypothetical protein
MTDPVAPPGGPPRDPWAELTDEERARAKRTLLHRLQAGGLAFLAVVCLSLLPATLSTEWPALGRFARVAVWIVGPAIPVALLVFALLRLRR